MSVVNPSVPAETLTSVTDSPEVTVIEFSKNPLQVQFSHDLGIDTPNNMLTVDGIAIIRFVQKHGAVLLRRNEVTEKDLSLLREVCDNEGWQLLILPEQLAILDTEDFELK